MISAKRAGESRARTCHTLTFFRYRDRKVVVFSRESSRGNAESSTITVAFCARVFNVGALGQIEFRELREAISRFASVR